MRTFKYGILIFLFSCCHEIVFAKKYFVDSRIGDDNNIGTNQNRPWKTLSKVNQVIFAPGDVILFARGSQWDGQLVPQGNGTPQLRITFGAYGKGSLPQIMAKGKYRDALLLKNLSHIIVQDLDISNLDTVVKAQKIGPTGVRILAEDIGTIRDILLKRLYIHDVNGDNKKGSKEGHGIFWDCQGPKRSNIENLQIEDCKVIRIDRNGIRGNGTFAFRDNWFPNKNLVIRGCYLEDIGGDGIVIKGFDHALVEYNKLFYIRTRAKDNAVGIWPHSSDNSLIQFNEVAYTKNQDWSNDGQSFDIDGNCNNTIIQNNYSHDNEGGFMLIISDAINAKSIMTKNNIIRNNLSVNDGNRRKRLFNFALETDSTWIYNNIFYNDIAAPTNIELVDIEHAIPKNIVFEGNEFIFKNKAKAIFTKSPKQYGAIQWKNNSFIGNFEDQQKLQNVSATGNKFKKNSAYPFNLLKSLNIQISK